ncbi:hypothetical protein [Pseudonocardia sp. TRM90224]|uniref:hypothetical protein n=1 Tax=Pseudonocardia sp. TRM90224 TaxID=2812678 RepID=UPI001E53EB64|nr:hypothetical protein [Pseudonocardia sp. TRM90224]
MTAGPDDTAAEAPTESPSGSPAEGPAAAPAAPVTPAVVPRHTGRTLPPRPPARPPIGEEPSILGLSRHSRSRLGSRLFTLFFVFVFALIVVQTIAVLLNP